MLGVSPETSDSTLCCRGSRWTLRRHRGFKTPTLDLVDHGLVNVHVLSVNLVNCCSIFTKDGRVRAYVKHVQR